MSSGGGHGLTPPCTRYCQASAKATTPPELMANSTWLVSQFGIVRIGLAANARVQPAAEARSARPVGWNAWLGLARSMSRALELDCDDAQLCVTNVLDVVCRQGRSPYSRANRRCWDVPRLHQDATVGI